MLPVKKRPFLLCCVGLILVACAPQEAATPDLSELLTRAEATDFHETSSHADVMEMAQALAAASDRVHFTTWWHHK